MKKPRFSSSFRDKSHIFLAFIYFLLQGTATCLRLSEVKIPNHILLGSPARLECLYELDKDESLYSIKWYKDGNEFYRYHPKDEPPGKGLSLPGVMVDLDNSTDCLVVLQSVPLEATGRYRCEVLGEAPAFHTVAEHGDMTVVALPAEGPRITGGRDRYAEGDTLRLSCASGPASPPPSLAWFINGEPATRAVLRGPRRRAMANKLHVSTLVLEFKVQAEHFKGGDLKLKCVSTITTLYWQSKEVSVEGDRPQRAPALESRDSAAQGGDDSRADRVQATTLNGASSCHRASTIAALLILFHKIMTDR